MSCQDTIGHKKTFDITIPPRYDTGMKEKNVRWEDDDWDRIEKAAKLEGLDTSNYIRRCVITTTRKEHPELFPRDVQ